MNDEIKQLCVNWIWHKTVDSIQMEQELSIYWTCIQSCIDLSSVNKKLIFLLKEILKKDKNFTVIFYVNIMTHVCVLLSSVMRRIECQHGCGYTYPFNSLDTQTHQLKWLNNFDWYVVVQYRSWFVFCFRFSANDVYHLLLSRFVPV